MLGALIASFLATDAGLSWQAPAACPDHAEVLRMAADLVGGPLDIRGTANAQVDEQDGAFVLRLTWTSAVGNGSRVARDADCLRLAQTTALVLATVLQPPRVPNGSPEPPPPPVFGLLRLSGLGTVGVQPTPQAGVTLTGGATWRFLRAEVWGGTGTASSIDLSVGSARFWLPVRAGARLCADAPLMSFELGGCVFGEAGALTATAQGLPRAENRVALWWSAGVAGSVAWVLHSRFRLRATVSGGPGRQLAFEIEGLGEVFRTTPLSGTAELGVELRLQ